jgi:hypothetical protein
MAVHAAGFSVVIRNSAIEQWFPGGLRAFQDACPNKTLCSDGLLTRVGFMVLDDANFFRLRLVAHGLAKLRDDAEGEIALVRQDRGCLSSCDWLRVERIEGRTVAWLRGRERGDIASSPFETGDLRLLAAPIVFEDAFPARKASQRAGKPGALYIGRPFVSTPPRLKWWRFWERDPRVLDKEGYERAFAAARDALDTESWPDRAFDEGRPLTPRLRRARALLEQCVAVRSDDWSSQFLLGRAYDLCGDDRSAYARYRTAWELQDDDSSLVGTSLAITCMRIGRAPGAVRILERVRAKNPQAADLISNYAVALFLCGRLEEALVMAQSALDKQPDDPITGAVLATIELVRAGRLAQPDRWPPN